MAIILILLGIDSLWIVADVESLPQLGMLQTRLILGIFPDIPNMSANFDRAAMGDIRNKYLN